MFRLSNQQNPPGMQVHAVPDVERAVDQNGRRLPWSYDFSGAIVGEQLERQPVEKGPFGRSLRRSRSGASRSRSKTAEPKREEDRLKLENMAAEDAVFGSLRRTATKDGIEARRDYMSESDPHALATDTSRAANIPVGTSDITSEPTEVLLWGFGDGLQWAAIDFYERVSNGCILEDYDRQPPGQRYHSAAALGRAVSQKSLSRAAMRKRNKFAGGQHWIKVTFESSQAAELAIARQPHTIKGHLVYAEPYQGRGPAKDEAVPATQAGAQITSDALPPTFTTGEINDSPNGSGTLSSATATAIDSRDRYGTPWNAPLDRETQSSPTASSATMGNGSTMQKQATGMVVSEYQQQTQGGQLRPRRTRVEGVTKAVVLPAELAMAPKQPKASWSSLLGANEIIGSAVPRKEDGTFDWDRASVYWRLFWLIDALLGTDFCGMRSDE